MRFFSGLWKIWKICPFFTTNDIDIIVIIIISTRSRFYNHGRKPRQLAEQGWVVQPRHWQLLPCPRHARRQVCPHQLFRNTLRRLSPIVSTAILFEDDWNWSLPSRLHHSPTGPIRPHLLAVTWQWPDSSHGRMGVAQHYRDCVRILKLRWFRSAVHNTVRYFRTYTMIRFPCSCIEKNHIHYSAGMPVV